MVGLPATRRRVLTGAAAGTAISLTGCLERLWSRADRSNTDQVSITIKAVPADEDIIATKIASQLRDNFQIAGIDASFEPLAKADLYRHILLDGEYDVFVIRHPGVDEYDALRALLHSRYISERGWQNPFHFSDVIVDDFLESQRMARESERERVLVDLFEHLVRTVPYTVVAFPHRISASRGDLSLAAPPRHALDYVDILSHNPGDGLRDGVLNVGVFGEELTKRLNPIVVDRNGISDLLELLYDPLVHRIDDEYIPWLARDIKWGRKRGSGLEATVTLRKGTTWHDGSPLDANDVVFTYRFLQDTSLGAAESAIPAPRYRGRQTLVKEGNAVDSRTVSFSFTTTNPSIAVRALQIPLLPRHIWEPRSAPVSDRQTEALVNNNENPIGSGLLFMDDVVTDVAVELMPFEGHALRTDAVDRPSIIGNAPQFDRLRFHIAPNAGAVGQALADGDIDLIGSPLPASEVAEIRTKQDLTVLTRPTDEFYMIGYNTHHPELGNHNVRRILSQLIDREHIVSELFAGFAAPATTHTSLFGIRNTDLVENGDQRITAFPGTDGEINPHQVQALFEEAGYRYEDGVLLQ